MPITLLPGGPYPLTVGPGCVVNITTDLIGPLPPGSRWDLGFFPSATDEVPIWREEQPASSNPQRLLPLMLPQTSSQSNQTVTVPDAETVHVQLTLLDSANVAVDSGSQDVPWNNTIGLGAQQNASEAIATGGGLTLEEHGWLDTIQTWINNTTKLAGRLALQSPAGAILLHPDIGTTNICGSPSDLVGRGTIPLPSFDLANVVVGAQLSVAVAPAGAGLRDGFVQEYSTRVAQLVTLHRTLDGSRLFVSEVLDLVLDSRLWMFANALPQEIGFDITPGFTLNFQFQCSDLRVLP